MILIDVYSRRLSLVNMYIPPTFSGNILYEVLEKLVPHVPFKLLVAGDFNNILDYALDTSNPYRSPNLDLLHWLKATGLTELWQ